MLKLIKANWLKIIGERISLDDSDVSWCVAQEKIKQTGIQSLRRLYVSSIIPFINVCLFYL